MKLTEYLIENADGEAYRAGGLEGMRHPAADDRMIRTVGGRMALVEEAKKLEKTGLIRVEWKDMGADIKCFHYAVSVLPELCRLAGLEDPRDRQLRHLATVRKWAEDAERTFLASYYADLIRRLEEGKEVKDTDMEDEEFFCCLNRAAKIERSVWRRQFSSEVLGDSKRFEKKYQRRVITVLRKHSPLSEEGMTDDDILRVHGIRTYSQTLEWKGPLVYRIDGREDLDSALNVFGTVINAQTLEHARPVSLSGIRRIMLIENKANYEAMPYREDTLYVFCHGFFSPKELRFLGALGKITDREIEYLHWGDMDLGGIRIFLYNQRNLFPELRPYRMDAAEYEKAITAGAGIVLEKGKREKLEKIKAGTLEDLKNCILEKGMEIEQESLLPGGV